jgi:hypothetical protein
VSCMLLMRTMQSSVSNGTGVCYPIPVMSTFLLSCLSEASMC